MTQRIVQGGTVTLSAYYRNVNGDLTTPVDPFISILDPGGTTVVSLAIPTEITTGFFQYQYPVSEAAEPGGWGVEWFGVVDGSAVDDTDVFTVITPSMVDTGAEFVTVSDLENYMQRTLTTAQQQAASVLIHEVTSEAEWKMGEAIGAQTWEEDVQVGPYESFIPLQHGPVHSVSSATLAGDTYTGYESTADGLVLTGGLSTGNVTGTASILFPHMVVSYVGGITMQRNLDVLANVVKGRVARMMQPMMNNAIDVTSISVEGYTAQLMEEDWTPREARILLSRRSRVRGGVVAPPPPTFSGSGGYGADIPPDG